MGVEERSHTLIQIAGIQARTGDREVARQTFRQAEQLADSVGLDDSTYQPHILLRIAEAEGRHGFRDEAIAVGRRLLRLGEAPIRREHGKAELYLGLTRLQVELGDREGLQETLRAGRAYYTTKMEPGYKAFASIYLVRMQAASGDVAGAVRMTRDPVLFEQKVPQNSSDFRRNALFSLVENIKAGDRETARPILEEASRVATIDEDPFPGAG